jgi:hypothetical protein
MARKVGRHNRPVWVDLHPLVHAAIAGLVLWFVVAAWMLFGGWEDMRLVLAVVSGFFFVAIAIPGTLWLTWRKHRDPDAARSDGVSLREWAAGEFDTAQGPRNAADAAVEILLPIAAVAFGMTTMGIALYVTTAGAAWP